MITTFPFSTTTLIIYYNTKWQLAMRDCQNEILPIEFTEFNLTGPCDECAALLSGVEGKIVLGLDIVQPVLEL